MSAKPIPSLDGYLADDSGRIYSANYRRKGIVGELSAYTNADGYRAIFVRVNRKATCRLVHRLVAEAHIPNPDRKPHINHKDGNKTNNAVANLEWCTDRENNVHAVQILGRKSPRGERSGKSKLRETDIARIRAEVPAGPRGTASRIARELGVKPGAVYSVMSGRTWGWK